MKVNIIGLFLLIFSFGSLYSQVIIESTIYDYNTKLPVPQANIYLAGTSIATKTNSEGRFKLSLDKAINTQLIVTHLSYQSLAFATSEIIPENIYLDENINELDEIVIISHSLFTRKQMLKAFRNNFLGITKPGKLCKILNEDDIQLRYNIETRELQASSKKPIQINNKYLGYNLEFSLVEFYVKYNSKTLNQENVKNSFFAGTSLFTDLAPDNRKIIKRRNESYMESSMYFFKNLVDNSLVEANIRIFNSSYQVNPYTYLEIGEQAPMKFVKLKPNTNIEKTLSRKSFGQLNILYKKRMQSLIVFDTDSIIVDNYGNISPIDEILYGGHMGMQKIGHMLPLDYELVE